MKHHRSKTKIASFVLAILTFFIINTNATQAQKISIMGNIRAFGIEKVVPNDQSSVNYKGTTAFNGNLRFYDKNKIAFRLGLGLNNLKYEFEDDTLKTNFEVARKSTVAIIGLEKHFGNNILIPYLGIYVPFTFNSHDKIKEIGGNFIDEIDNKSFYAGANVDIGLWLKLFKFIRIGAEFNVGVSQFKSEIIDNLVDGQSSKIKLKNLDYGGAFAIGLAF